MGQEQPSFLGRAGERLLRKILFRSGPADRDELEKFIEQASQDEIIDEDTEDMIRGVFDVAQRRVGDIMVPRSNIVAIDQDQTIGEAIEIISECGHSRYPVTVNDDKDHVQGILMAKELLPLASQTEKRICDFPQLMRKPVIVPESKRVDTMLKDFQKDHFHLAVVVDEYGGVCGVVTIEDIVELIVGEINDEYEQDTEANNIVKGNDNTYIVQGITPLEEFCEYFKTELPQWDVDTVAGLVTHASGHFPKPDEVININGFSFKVLNSTPHQVHSVIVSHNGA